jgi:hypothetical protein
MEVTATGLQPIVRYAHASFTPLLITVVALIAVYGRREQPPGHGLRGA